jgi:hypothetical protein
MRRILVAADPQRKDESRIGLRAALMASLETKT